MILIAYNYYLLSIVDPKIKACLGPNLFTINCCKSNDAVLDSSRGVKGWVPQSSCQKAKDIFNARYHDSQMIENDFLKPSKKQRKSRIQETSSLPAISSLATEYQLTSEKLQCPQTSGGKPLRRVLRVCCKFPWTQTSLKRACKDRYSCRVTNDFK